MNESITVTLTREERNFLVNAIWFFKERSGHLWTKPINAAAKALFVKIHGSATGWEL